LFCTEVPGRKLNKDFKETPIPRNIMDSQHSLPHYRSRLGGDAPMDDHLLNKIIVK
jgi:hypothetical protein